MSKPPRYDYKVRNFDRALEKLREVVTWPSDRLDDVHLESAIQRFGSTYELAWKTTREVLLHRDGTLQVLGSRDAVRFGFERGLIADRQVWFDMIDDRHRTSHVYNERLAREIFDNVVAHYLPALSELRERIRSLTAEGQ